MKTASANILLKALDDDPDELDIIKQVCLENGIENYQLHTDEDEFFKNMNSDVNLCIVDHSLGLKTGIEITKKIKDMNEDNYVIVSSGIKDFNVAISYMKAGADDWIEKDVYDRYVSELIPSLRRGFSIARKRIDKAELMRALQHQALTNMGEIARMLEKLNNPIPK